MDSTVKKSIPVLRLATFEGEAPQQITDKIFIPDWNNRPVELPPVLTLGGLSILTHQNITAIIAKQGMGKSSNCESILASFLNPNADSLGYKVNEDCEGVIYIDFERTTGDVWNSFYRMCRRAGILEGQGITGVQIAGMRSIPRLEDRLEAIEYLLQKNPSCSLLLLDGAGDMVTDTNDLPQAIECRIFLRELTVKYDLSILTTLHPNPNSDKPRGHIGSEIIRESEGVLIIKKGQGDCRLITSDFEHGKNRNGANVQSAFKWSDEQQMFISIDVESVKMEAQAAKDEKKKLAMVELVKDILQPLESKTEGEVVKAIMDMTNLKANQARLYKTAMINFKIIVKRSDGLYSIAC
jgi:hypothetical protein